MKWFEVVTGSDGYYTPNRFKTEQEASEFVGQLEEDNDTDIHVSEGPYEVDSDSKNFWYEEEK